MAVALVRDMQSDAVKREAEKYQQILSVETELEAKRFVTKLSTLMSSIYDDCERSHTKAFKENLKLLTSIISTCSSVDEVWVKRERERLRRNDAAPSDSSKRVEVADTSRTQGRERMSASALSNRSSASCSRVQKHHQSQMESVESEIADSARGVSFTKDPRSKEKLPDNPLGPGQYSPKYRITASRSVAAFSTTSQRMKDFANKEISPGPAYSPSERNALAIANTNAEMVQIGNNGVEVSRCQRRTAFAPCASLPLQVAAVNMATESNIWWTTRYTTFSIKDLQALPIFAKFASQHFPYRREEAHCVESFSVDKCRRRLEWSNSESGLGESFQHQSDTDTWTYERRYLEGEVRCSSTSHLSADVEWGEFVRQFKDYSVHELWRLRGCERRYEKFTVEEGEKRGIRTGRIPALEGMEMWTETFWERGDESESEKIWNRPDASGGENQHKRGDYWWGEAWHSAPDKTERKMWHTAGDHDWGHISGHSGNKVWNEKWDITKTTRTEERLTQENDRRRGFRYVRNAADWYRQEWDGLRILGIDEGAEIIKKQDFVQQLDEVLVSAHDTVLKGEHTLELLLREASEFQEEVDAIVQERKDIPKPDNNDADALFATIRVERELADKQERLKQRMINASHSEHGKYYQLHLTLDRLLRASQSTYLTLSQALFHDPSVASACDRWLKSNDLARRRRNFSSYDRDCAYIDSLLSIEHEKKAQINRFVGGLELRDVQKTMKSVWEAVAKADAVYEKLTELVKDQGLREKADRWEKEFEVLRGEYSAKKDPEKLQESVWLLIQYLGTQVMLAGRLRGYSNPDLALELSTIDSELSASSHTSPLSHIRGKVRSARSAPDSPHQLIDRNLTRLVLFLRGLNSVLGNPLSESNPALLTQLNDAVGRTLDGGEEFELLIEKSSVLSETSTVLSPESIVALRGRIAELEDEVRDLEEIISHKSVEVSELAVRLDEKENYCRQLELIVIEKETRITTLVASSHSVAQPLDVGSLLEGLQRLKSQLDAANEERIFMETRIEEMEVMHHSLQALHEEIDYYKELVIQHEETINESRIRYESMKNELNAEVHRKEQLFDDKDQENTQLLVAIKHLRTEAAEWKLKYEQLLPEAEENRAKVKELEAFKLSALSFESENVRLKEMIRQLNEVQGERGAQYEEILKALNQKLSEHESTISQREEDLTHMRQLVSRHKSLRYRQLLLRIIFIITNILKSERVTTFLSWKLNTFAAPDSVSEDVMMVTKEVKSTIEEDEQEWTAEEYMRLSQADESSVRCRMMLLEGNMLFRHLKADLVRFDVPLLPQLMFTLLEEVMDRKLASDNSNLLTGKRPALFPDYFLDYMLRTRNGKRIAQRELSKFVPGLYNQVQACIPLAIVGARLLQVFHHNPATLEASILVLRYNKSFKALASGYEEKRKARDLPPLGDAEKKVTGGVAALCDVLDAFFDTFASEEVFLWHFLRHIKPTKVYVSDYVFSVVLWFASTKKNLSRDSLYSLLTPSAQVHKSDFIDSVTTALGLHFSRRILKEAFEQLTPAETVSAELIREKVENAAALSQDDLTVTKGGLLTAVLEAYSAHQRRTAAVLHEQFHSHGRFNLDFEGFSRMVKEHCHTVPTPLVAKLLEVGVKLSKDTPVDVVGYPAALIANPVGDLSKDPLCVKELSLATEEHVFDYDLLSGNKHSSAKIVTTQISTRSTRISHTVSGTRT